MREHRSRNLAPAGAPYSLELYAVDSWHDGILEVTEPAVVLDREALPIGQARLLLTGLADVLAQAA